MTILSYLSVLLPDSEDQSHIVEPVKDSSSQYQEDVESNLKYYLALGDQTSLSNAQSFLIETLEYDLNIDLSEKAKQNLNFFLNRYTDPYASSITG